MFIAPGVLLDLEAPLGAECKGYFAPKGASSACVGRFYKHVAPNGAKTRQPKLATYDLIDFTSMVRNGMQRS
jgi:hypothetical protein